MKKYLILGGGISGLGAASLLKKSRCEIFVSDRTKITGHNLDAFEELGCKIYEPGHKTDHLNHIDEIILSPGISPRVEILVEARNRGIPITSEIDLALKSFKGRVIGVTGTNGKSTTCAMIHHISKKLGLEVSLGGNFGTPPSLLIANGEIMDTLILELSSYQLESSHLISPYVSIFTSFSHDHLARHGSLEGYFRAKWRIFENLPTDGLAILPDYVLSQAENYQLHLPKCDQQTVNPKRLESFIDTSIFKHKERHMQLDGLFASLCVAKLTSQSLSEVAPLLSDYRGLPHRCEIVGTFKSFPLINDSKSTNVESTLVAIESQDHPVVLLMGGQGKEEPYSPLAAFKEKVLRLYTFGTSGKIIYEELKTKVKYAENHPTLKQALNAVKKHLKLKPSPVLFSPGCASFDEFHNYEERGNFFIQEMKDLIDANE